MSGKGAKGLSGKGLSGKGAKGTMKGGDKKKPTSRSVKAGLQFPVGRIHRFLKVRSACSSSRYRRRSMPRIPHSSRHARVEAFHASDASTVASARRASLAASRVKFEMPPPIGFLHGRILVVPTDP